VRVGDERTARPTAANVVNRQLRYAWLYSRGVLEDLDEDEYFWEPAPLCWSVRPRTPEVRGWGRGEFACEDAFPAPEPLPVTTIAWRVIHLAAWTDIYREFTFGDLRPDLNDFDVPGDVSSGLQWLSDAQDRFLSDVAALDDATLFELRPAHWGGSVPVVRVVTLMLTEHVHHIAEIGALRDLHRGHARIRPPFAGT
jgi:hypothetical protein